MDDVATDTTPAARARRSVTSLDLGELREGVARASALAGMGSSTWLRELARRELDRLAREEGAPAAAEAPQEPTKPKDDPEAQPAYRAWLDAGLTTELDAFARRGGFRTRAAALRGLLAGLGGASAAMSTGDAVNALGESNDHLAAIRRSLVQISRSLNEGATRLTVAERLALDRAIDRVEEHLGVAAPLVGGLRPLLKTKAKGKRR
jgi:hypothetical protein